MKVKSVSAGEYTAPPAHGLGPQTQGPVTPTPPRKKHSKSLERKRSHELMRFLGSSAQRRLGGRRGSGRVGEGASRLSLDSRASDRRPGMIPSRHANGSRWWRL